MKIAETSLILSKTFYCSDFVAMLRIITTTFSILFNCYYMGKYKNLKKKPYQHHTESSQMPALALLLICGKMPFLVSLCKWFCLKEEELRKCLELKNALNHKI